MDVIALAQQGLRNAVATLGTATSEEHIKRLFRVVPSVLFCFDGDSAGRNAAWRALEVRACRTCRTAAGCASCSSPRARTRTAWCARGHRRLPRPHQPAGPAAGRLLLRATERRSRPTLPGGQGAPGHPGRTADRAPPRRQPARPDAPAPRRITGLDRRRSPSRRPPRPAKCRRPTSRCRVSG